MRLFIALLALALPLTLAAQTAPTSASSKPGAKSAAKSTAKRPAVSKKAAKPVAAPVEVAEPGEIEPDRMAVVPMVLRGESSCEFGHKVQVVEHPSLPGRFLLEYRGIKHVLTPQPTTTGVVRLEDKRSGMIWLQVPVKSMLMDSRRGQRLADNCMHATQTAELTAAQQTPPEQSALQ
jgi:hypothetical protein